MNVRSTIARNTLFNIMGRLFEGIFGLTLTWFVVRHLGTAGWGLWSLVAVFTGYATLFDLGIASGFAKYIAEFDARGERHRINALVTTGLAFYFLLSLLIITIVWILTDVTVDRLITPLVEDTRLTGQTVEDLRFLCRGAAILFGVNNCVAPFANVPVGLQRMGINNALSMAVTVVKFVAAIAFIEAGWGVRGLFAAQALSVGLIGAGCVVAAFVLMPQLRVSPRHLDRDMFRRLFSFGWRTQVAKLANLIEFQTDRMVVAAAYRFGDMGLVGLFGMGEYLAMKMRQAPALLVSALIPAASALDALSREEHLEKLYLHSTKYMAAVTMPLAAYMICCADLLLHAWLGPQEGLHQAGWVMRILCVGYVFNLLPGPGISIVMGKGLAATPMYAGLISMSVNIAASVLLFFVIGFYGIPLGTTLGMAAATTWFFLHVRRHIHVRLDLLALQALLWPTLACLPGSAVCIAVAVSLSDRTGHLVNLGGAGAAGIVFVLGYVLILRLTPFLDPFDHAFLLHTLRLGRLPGMRAILRAAQEELDE